MAVSPILGDLIQLRIEVELGHFQKCLVCQGTPICVNSVSRSVT